MSWNSHGEPLAYFLTWTGYGTWLHGDGRGSIDDGHNVYGRPVVAPSNERLDTAETVLVETPIFLSAEMRRIIGTAIEDHCKVRSWKLWIANPRTNHVHVVVTAARHRPQIVAGQFKAWSTRRLREAGLLGDRRRVWTNQASTRYLWDEKALDDAIEYVAKQ